MYGLDDTFLLYIHFFYIFTFFIRIYCTVFIVSYAIAVSGWLENYTFEEINVQMAYLSLSLNIKLDTWKSVKPLCIWSI